MAKKWKAVGWIATFIPWIFVFGLVTNLVAQVQKKSKVMKDMYILSKAFQQNGMIPSKYTCDDENISPPLEWSGFPDGTKSFALICDDPDAPSGTFVHWVVYNIPSSVTRLDEHFLVKGNPVKEIMSGMNSYRKPEYMGPCPPGSVHRYFFKIYALDCFLDAREGMTARELTTAMEGHVVAKGDLMGKYSRK
jgi:Raf kinase inhibitor-like YbhB/YbcL family protein